MSENMSAGTVVLTPPQKLLCERVVNVFETGSIRGNYAAISIFEDGPNDIRQITYGRSQTTEYGNLRELVQMYVDAGGRFADQLGGYVPRIGRVALVDDAVFKDLLRRAGKEDQVMRDTQDAFFDRRYFQPALRWAGQNGFSRALSVLVIYDSFVHSGQILDLLRSRFTEPPPASGGNEQVWIREYVEVRHQWLLTHPRAAVRSSAYRTRDLGREIARGNWDLSMLPILANGVPVGDDVADARSLLAADVVPFFGSVGTAPTASIDEGIRSSAWGTAFRSETASSPASDEDPAAPSQGDTVEVDPAIARVLANYGAEPAGLDLSPLAAAPSPGLTGRPLLSLDLHRARTFLDACRTSIPRVTYGLGKKVPFLGAVPGRDFTQVDCSGFVREAIRLSTSPPLPFPDGSVNQHDWVRAHGFEKSTVPAGLQNDGTVRIAFLRPQDVSSGIGHVVLIAGGKTLESHGGVGPDSRRWDGSSWQAKTYVYVLAQEAQVATISSAAALLASTAPGSMYTVHRGRRYRATLALGFFEQLAPNSEIEARLRNYGFADVHATGSGSVRQAVALWPGPDTTAALDPHIVKVEELPADALAGSQSLGGFDAASAVAALPASPWKFRA